MTLIDPMFGRRVEVKADLELPTPYMETASPSPLNNKPMVHVYIGPAKGPKVQVLADLDNRLVLPIRK